MEKRSYNKAKHRSQKLAFGIFRLLSLCIVLILFAILGFIIYKGIGVINWEFLTTAPTNGMTAGGILPAIVGTFCLMAGSALFAFPVGVMSGIYMKEYVPKGWVVRFIRMMTNNLSGIPSIVFGLFGYLMFNISFGWGFSMMAGVITLAMMILPLIIRTTEEALLAVPDSYREGSFGLGAGKMRTVFRVILPTAVPGIMSGVILSIGRIVGESAALIFTSGSGHSIPGSLVGSGSSAATLTVHMYILSNEGLHVNEAFASAVVLLALTFLINLVSDLIERRIAKKKG